MVYRASNRIHPLPQPLQLPYLHYPGYGVGVNNDSGDFSFLLLGKCAVAADRRLPCGDL